MLTINTLIWYYEIEFKSKEPNLYQKYGFDEKYKSPEMDKFLESYKPITEHHFINEELKNTSIKADV